MSETDANDFLEKIGTLTNDVKDAKFHVNRCYNEMEMVRRKYTRALDKHETLKKKMEFLIAEFVN